MTGCYAPPLQVHNIRLFVERVMVALMVKFGFSWRLFKFGRICLNSACLLLAVAVFDPAIAGSPLSGMTRPALAAKAPDKVVLVAIARAGARLVAVGEHGVIIYSDNNGQSWVQSAVPVDLTLTAIGFATPQIGWAAGHEGIILKTMDGGKTWVTQLNGLQINQQTLATAQAATAANDPSLGTAKALLRAQHFINSGPVNPFLAILVNSPQDAIAFGAYRMVMKTTDGGKTWSDWDLHIGDAMSHNLYDVTKVGSDIYVAGEAGAIFRSTDGGNTFNAVTAPADTTMFEILPAGNGAVFTCGVAGQAYISEDQGKSWQAISLPTQTNLTAAIVLRSGALVVGDETGDIFVSQDHGKSFTLIPETEPMGIFGMAQASNGNVVAVGNAGVIVILEKTLTQS